MKPNMRLKSMALVLALAATTAGAQPRLVPEDPDWREAAPPPPPAVRTEGLIPIEMSGSQLRFGVDPASISIGKDGIVRYVVVASSTSGAVNAIYEGLRCSSSEMKVYARYTGNSWKPTDDAPWRELHEPGLSRHTLVIARNGACMGRGATLSAEQMARDLRSGNDMRFRPEAR